MTRPRKALALAAVVLGAAAGGGGAWAATHANAASHPKQAPKQTPRQRVAPAAKHQGHECPFSHSTDNTADL
jgi:hypothetical protein